MLCLREVALVYLNSMLLEQLAVLLLEGKLPMMLLLSLDVGRYPIFFGIRAGEGSVALRPTLELWERRLLFYPHGGGGLYIAHQVGQRNRWMQVAEDVDMVLHGVDTV